MERNVSSACRRILSGGVLQVGGRLIASALGSTGSVAFSAARHALISLFDLQWGWVSRRGHRTTARLEPPGRVAAPAVPIRRRGVALPGCKPKRVRQAPRDAQTYFVGVVDCGRGCMGARTPLWVVRPTYDWLTNSALTVWTDLLTLHLLSSKWRARALRLGRSARYPLAASQSKIRRSRRTGRK